MINKLRKLLFPDIPVKVVNMQETQLDSIWFLYAITLEDGEGRVYNVEQVELYGYEPNATLFVYANCIKDYLHHNARYVNKYEATAIAKYFAELNTKQMLEKMNAEEIN